MADKCPPCKKGAPGWMVTFGDLMSLLLTFFVLLLSFAQMDIVKFQEMAGSMKDAFGVQRIQQVNPMPTGESLIEIAFTQEVILVHLMEKLQIVLTPMIDNGEAEVVEQEEGFVLRLLNDALFTPGTVHLRRDVEPVLQQIANLLSSVENQIHVTGHTDNLPVDPGGPYPSNWALSAARAASVVNFFATRGGLDPTRLQARGMGEFAPLDPNDTPEGRARNQRIEITITRVVLPERHNQPAAGGNPLATGPTGRR